VEEITWLDPYSMSVRHIVKTQHTVRLRHATLATNVKSVPVPCQIRAHIFFARKFRKESYLVITTDPRLPPFLPNITKKPRHRFRLSLHVIQSDTSVHPQKNVRFEATHRMLFYSETLTHKQFVSLSVTHRKLLCLSVTHRKLFWLKVTHRKI